MFNQLLSLAGAALVLIPFVALQLGRMEREDVAFNVLNFFGSAFLAWVAIADHRAGFIVLEVSWAIFSLVPLVRRRAASPSA
jgi:predicted anti-sigma-YlaC factor YlaD